MKQVQKPKKPIIFYYVVALIVILLLNLLLFPRLLEPKVTEVDYGKFLQMVDNNEISEVQIQSNEIIFSDKSSPANYYKTGVMNDYKLVDRLYEAGITEFGTPIIEQMSPLMEFLLTWVIPIVVMVALGQWLMKRMTSKMMGGMGNAMSFGKSNAKVYVQSETGIKFADVAGEEEAKDQSVFSHSVRNISQKRARTTRTPDNKTLGVISSPVSQWSRASAYRP